jgi:hypothetical protein
VVVLGASFHVTLEITVAPAVSRLHGFAVTTPDIVRCAFHSCGPRVADDCAGTQEGTPVPKHVGFDTYHELYFVVFYGMHLLVNP